MKVTLGVEEQRQFTVKPTTNLAAYDAFLRGNSIWHGGGNDPKALQSAIAQCEQAVKPDPSFAVDHSDAEL